MRRHRRQRFDLSLSGHIGEVSNGIEDRVSILVCSNTSPDTLDGIVTDTLSSVSVCVWIIYQAAYQPT